LALPTRSNKGTETGFIPKKKRKVGGGRMKIGEKRQNRCMGGEERKKTTIAKQDLKKPNNRLPLCNRSSNGRK